MCSYDFQGHGHRHIGGEGATHEIAAANGYHEKLRKDESTDSQDEGEESLISTQR